MKYQKGRYHIQHKYTQSLQMQSEQSFKLPTQSKIYSQTSKQDLLKLQNASPQYFESKNNTSTVQRVLQNRDKLLGLNPLTNEQKFQKRFEQFSKLQTFVDFKHVLKKLNHPEQKLVQENVEQKKRIEFIQNTVENNQQSQISKNDLKKFQHILSKIQNRKLFISLQKNIQRDRNNKQSQLLNELSSEGIKTLKTQQFQSNEALDSDKYYKQFLLQSTSMEQLQPKIDNQDEKLEQIFKQKYQSMKKDQVIFYKLYQNNLQRQSVAPKKQNPGNSFDNLNVKSSNYQQQSSKTIRQLLKTQLQKLHGQKMAKHRLAEYMPSISRSSINNSRVSKRLSSEKLKQEEVAQYLGQSLLQFSSDNKKKTENLFTYEGIEETKESQRSSSPRKMANKQYQNEEEPALQISKFVKYVTEEQSRFLVDKKKLGDQLYMLKKDSSSRFKGVETQIQSIREFDKVSLIMFLYKL